MTVLVTGVTGKIGAGVAAALHERGWEVRGGSSHPENAVGRPYAVQEVDLSRPATLGKALDEVDAVFLYPNTDAVDGVIAELRQAGVRTVLLSSSSVLLPSAGMIAEHHRQAEDALLASGLPLTILRPDVFATNSLDWADQIRSGEVALPYPNAHVAPVHEADVVDAAVATLLEPDHLGRAYTLTGPESMTQVEQIQTIGAALGRAVAVRELSPAEWKARGHLPDVVADALLSIWANADASPRSTAHTVQAVTGQAPRTFAQWAGESAALFV